MSEEAARTHLRSFVERIERLEEEIAGLNGDKRDVFAEAKGHGFDTKALKVVLGIRRQDPSARAEQNAIVVLYLSELGMAEAAEEVEQNDPRVHVQAHPRTCTREDEPPHPEFAPPARNEGEAVQVGIASDERSAGTAGTPCTEQSEEFVTATGAGEAGCDPAVDPAPASDGEVSPEGASTGGVTASAAAPTTQTGTRSAGDGDPPVGRQHAALATVETPATVGRDRPQSNAGYANPTRREANGEDAGVTSPGGEQPGTPSIARRAAEAAVRSRLAPKPLHPGDPLYEIRLAAREGRRLGTPVEVSP